MRDISNAKWSSDTSIDVVWNHPDFGLIPYTAVDGSGEAVMQEIWDALMRGDYGPIAPQETSADVGD